MGAFSIGVAFVLAWEGSKSLSAEQSVGYLLLYWGAFLFFLLVAMYVVLLDIRYIRMMYMMGRREIYHGTLGSEEFRRELLAKIEKNDSKAGDKDGAQSSS